MSHGPHCVLWDMLHQCDVLHNATSSFYGTYHLFTLPYNFISKIHNNLYLVKLNIYTRNCFKLKVDGNNLRETDTHNPYSSSILYVQTCLLAITYIPLKIHICSTFMHKERRKLTEAEDKQMMLSLLILGLIFHHCHLQGETERGGERVPA